MVMGFSINNRLNPSTALIARGSVSSPKGGSSGGAPSTGSPNGSAGKGEGPERGAGTGNPLGIGGGQSSFDDTSDLMAGRAGRYRRTPRPSAPPPARPQAPARDFNAEVDKIAKDMARYANALKPAVQLVDSYLKQPTVDQIHKLIQIKTRLELVLREKLLTNALAPQISHLYFVLEHSENQNNPKLLAKTRAMIKQAMDISGVGPAMRQLNRVNGLLKMREAAINSNPVLKALSKFSKLLNIIGSVFKGVESARESPASNPLLKLASGAASGFTYYHLLVLGGPLVLADEVAGTRMVSGSVNNTVDTFAVFLEFLCGGDLRDTSGLEKLRQKMESGGNGQLVQAATRLNAALDAVLSGDPQALNDFVEGCLKTPNFLLRFGVNIGQGAQMWTTPEGRKIVTDAINEYAGKLKTAIKHTLKDFQRRLGF